MVDALPVFEPFELWGLTYDGAMGSAKVGMAVRRAHWCSPVVIHEGGKFLIDDDGELSRYVPTWDDRRADDWNCQKRAEG